MKELYSVNAAGSWREYKKNTAVSALEKGKIRGKLARCALVYPNGTVREAIGDGNVARPQGQVVTEGLIENGSRQFRRGLAFHDQVGDHRPVETNNVKTLTTAANGDFPFHGHERGGVMPVLDEKMDHVLTNPFLGRELEVTATNDVEYPVFPGFFLYLVIKGRKGQGFHGSTFHFLTFKKLLSP